MENKLTLMVLVSLVMGLLVASSALAHDITIFDTVVSGGTGWYNRGTANGSASEDQEVEPNCVTGDAWDLEAFAISTDGKLAIIGTYDFVNGAYRRRQHDGGPGELPGDGRHLRRQGLPDLERYRGRDGRIFSQALGPSVFAR